MLRAATLSNKAGGPQMATPATCDSKGLMMVVVLGLALAAQTAQADNYNKVILAENYFAYQNRF